MHESFGNLAVLSIVGGWVQFIVIFAILGFIAAKEEKETESAADANSTDTNATADNDGGIR